MEILNIPFHNGVETILVFGPLGAHALQSINFGHCPLVAPLLSIIIIFRFRLTLSTERLISYYFHFPFVTRYIEVYYINIYNTVVIPAHQISSLESLPNSRAFLFSFWSSISVSKGSVVERNRKRPVDTTRDANNTHVNPKSQRVW